MANRNVPVSVLIAAKNEANNIPALITSLENINYPHELLEIIIIDDNSTDDTKQLVVDFANQHEYVKIFSATDKKFPGKKGALEIGFREATGEFILVTDADCIIPPDWINFMISPLIKGYDYVFGHIAFNNYTGFTKGFFAFDNFNAQLVSHTLINMNLPGSAGAASMAFQKSAYEKIGGFEGIKTKSLSGDDDLVLQRARKEKMKIASVINRDSIVSTDSKNNFREFIIQRSRHISASHSYNFGALFSYGLWHFSNLILTLSLPAMIFDPWFGLFYLLRILSSAVLFYSKKDYFGYKFSLTGILVYPALYDSMMVINWINSFISGNKWK